MPHLSLPTTHYFPSLLPPHRRFSWQTMPPWQLWQPLSASARELRGTGVVHIHLIERNRCVEAEMGGAPSPNQPLNLLSHVEIKLGVT
ncbi:E3 ubiquitin-protein ligase complex slx8-rfp subunit slx8 [Pyrus ussuriensis x Pyrus communis]|uniref:E3 ubiquitin-protein ligase complex slx8-rfp subunit slx8 n=1 Tax=Pyrus ussuriensis x Pyrus communis TaxID=2448454 RepID=A0A5N5FIJ1_9ROSA|nr:E3 ubiquitin-protein ligase complex slx8-rfp subunit slx8 [Pyrus ussuriensis x Pyrus communis]